MNNTNKGFRQSNGGVLIFAPHPDDETLGCAGVILKAVCQGRRVRVVICTNGDGFAKAAAVLSGKDEAVLTSADFLEVARVRQQGALDATRILGLAPKDLIFLGYPDGGLARMPESGNIPFTQEFTKKNCTYGLIAPDYHTQAHGQPAPYVRSAALADVMEVLVAEEPAEIYVTAAVDGHADHREWCTLVHEATAAAVFKGVFYAYLIHSTDGSWPTPRGPTPGAPFESMVVNGQTVPSGIRWPPDERRPMTAEESALKLRAIQAYELEMRLAGRYIESFVKSEEVFWRASR